MPEITVRLGDQTLQTCRFDGELLRIGRSRENDVVLENLSVSRHHAQIRVHEGRFILTDMSSANGTLVNGVKVTKTEVVDEDVITIGKHKLFFSNVPAEIAEDFSTEQRTVMVEPKAEAWLLVDSGRLKGREFKIVRFETSLGKAPSNDVVLTDDWLLSKKQAIILRKGNHSFEIQDLGGLRKVKVNGKTVSGKVDLKDGDRVELGGTALIFHATEGAPRPTGRVPKEIQSETPAPKLMRAAFARAAAGDRDRAEDALDNESLDLEDGYQNLKVTLKGTPQTSHPAAEDQQGDIGDEASHGEVAASTDSAVDTPVERGPKQEIAAEDTPDRDEAAKSTPGPEPTAPTSMPHVAAAGANASSAEKQASGNGSGQHRNGEVAKPQRNVFEDTRSGGRRKRKHQQRAAQKQESSGSEFKSAGEEQAKESVAVKDSPGESRSAGADEKEIQIWEAALNNASPAIRRQAARTLKKLTGRDYDV